MVNFIDIHRSRYGVEPICEVLPIAPSTYYRHTALRKSPDLRSKRAKRDEMLRHKIRDAWEASDKIYGSQKVWREFGKNGETVARCTVERLMRQMGICGVRRGKT